MSQWLPHVGSSCLLNRCTAHFWLVFHTMQCIRNMDCRTRINPPCVMININHIRFITNKNKWSTFLVEPTLKFWAVFLYVPFLLAKETLWIFLYDQLSKNLGLILSLIPFLLSLSRQIYLFTLFNYQPFLFLNTHSQ